MTTIAPDWLHAAPTRRVMAALAPMVPHFVGGCVRDALLGRPTGDIDIAVRGRPEETLRLARGAGLAAYPTGMDHGVVTLTVDGALFEIASLRRDVATDGRRAVIAYADTLLEDARRRDFTMNALYATEEGLVADPTGEGVRDLTARCIRFIGEATRRIEEDYLRILRFFRFHAQLGVLAYDEPSLAACRSLAPGLARISAERILAEMLKLLAAADPEPALRAMGAIADVAMPGAVVLTGLSAQEVAAGAQPDPLRRLAALGGYGALPLSRAHRSRLAAIDEAGAAMAAGEPVAQVAYRQGAAATRDACLIRLARGQSVPAEWSERAAQGEAAVFPVTARDLLERGRVPGPALGAELTSLEAAWLASGFALSRDQLLAIPARNDPDPT